MIDKAASTQWRALCNLCTLISPTTAAPQFGRVPWGATPAQLRLSPSKQSLGRGEGQDESSELSKHHGKECKPHSQHSHWIFTRCGAVSGTSSALPITAHLPHTQGIVGRAVTQREVKPHQGSTREQQESVKRGNEQTQAWQESRAHLLQGQALWKAQDSCLGLLSTARLGFFHSSSHIPVFPPGCAVGRLLGGGSAAAPTLPFPRKWGRRLPDGRAGWKDKAKLSQVPHAVSHRLQGWRTPPKIP